MISKRYTPGWEAVSRPSKDAVEVLRQVKQQAKGPVIAAEVGVGIGASTVEFLQALDGRDELHLFDREPVLSELLEEISAVPTASIVVPHPNATHLYASYAWELATMARKLDRTKKPVEVFDFVYLDGAHAFHHDAAACAVLKRMIKPGGYLVLDDMHWTFNTSPTMNPTNRPELLEQYTAKQLSTPHVALVVDVLLRGDRHFMQVFLTDDRRPARAVFRRRTRSEVVRNAFIWRLKRARRLARRLWSRG